MKPGGVNWSKFAGIAPYLSLMSVRSAVLNIVALSQVAMPSAMSGAGMNFEIFKRYLVTKKVMAAIELCANAKLDFFLSAVVTRESHGDVDWLLDLARRLGVMVNFQIPQFNPEMYGPNAKSWMPAPDEVRAILGRITAAKEAGAPVLFSSRSYRHTIGWKDYAVERVERPGEVSPCTAGKFFLQVEPNGDIYPCVLHIGRFTPKNVVRDGVEAAWRHAQQHSCFDCYNTWLNENRAIFDLSPAILTNFWRNYMHPRPARSAG